jgi:hypothetical protein
MRAAIHLIFANRPPSAAAARAHLAARQQKPAAGLTEFCLAPFWVRRNKNIAAHKNAESARSGARTGLIRKENTSQ